MDSDVPCNLMPAENNLRGKILKERNFLTKPQGSQVHLKFEFKFKFWYFVRSYFSNCKINNFLKDSGHLKKF